MIESFKSNKDINKELKERKIMDSQIINIQKSDSCAEYIVYYFAGKTTYIPPYNNLCMEFALIEDEINRIVPNHFAYRDPLEEATEYQKEIDRIKAECKEIVNKHLMNIQLLCYDQTNENIEKEK